MDVARSAPTRRRSASTVGGDKQAVLNLELEFPLFEEAGIRAWCSPTPATRSRAAQYSDPAVPLSLYKSVGLRHPLVEPHRPAPLRVGHPARPPQGPSDGEYIDQPLDFQFTIGNFF